MALMINSPPIVNTVNCEHHLLFLPNCALLTSMPKSGTPCTMKRPDELEQWNNLVGILRDFCKACQQNIFRKVCTFSKTNNFPRTAQLWLTSSWFQAIKCRLWDFYCRRIINRIKTGHVFGNNLCMFPHLIQTCQNAIFYTDRKYKGYLQMQYNLHRFWCPNWCQEPFSPTQFNSV